MVKTATATGRWLQALTHRLETVIPVLLFVNGGMADDQTLPIDGRHS
ncbi:MAG TPA: hypothetical protein VMH22_14965 [bacterium]|nr:hypothetical protein [bacterium]